MKSKETDAWKRYQSGKDYNYKINYYDDVDKNEAFYAGDQWRGLKSKGMPTPVFNIFKRITNFFISWIMSSNISAVYNAEYVGDEPETEKQEGLLEASEYLTSNFKYIWEKTKMTKKTRQLLLDGALSGDMCIYAYWEDIDIGQRAKGRIQHEVIDGSRVFFGNPVSREVEGQPYIIIEKRELVEDLIDEAIKYKQDYSHITSDKNYQEQIGNRGKVELDSSEKTISLTTFWIDDKTGTVHAKKETKNGVIRPEWDLKIKKYPIAWANWDTRKNSYHGQAIGTGLIPNQIYINQMFAMVMVFWQLVGFPKVVYDKTRIDSWSNRVGGAIGVTGDVTTAARYMNPSTISGQIMLSIEKAIEYTKDMLGLTDAFAGDVRPENTSAIVVITKQASIPLEGVKMELYNLVEDLAYIDLEFMKNYYGKRKVKVQVADQTKVIEYDFNKISSDSFETKVDVGPSSYYSEAASAQVLDNLLMQGHIELIDYYERMPDSMIPNRKQLIRSLLSKDKRNMLLFEIMAQFMETLPPEQQQELQSLPPEEMEQQVIDLMLEDSPMKDVL